MKDQDRIDDQEREVEDRNKSKKKKGHGALYTVLVILVLLLAAFIWFVFFYHPEPSSTTSQNSSTTVTDEANTADDTANTTTDKTTTDNATDTNSSGEINTIGTETDINGLKQTLTDAQINQTIGTTTAPEGQTYLKVDWTINNTTSGELGFNPNNYVAYANGNQVQPVRIDDPTVNPLTAGTIQPGGSVTGSLVYQIPTTWSEVQIYSHINPTTNQEVEYRISSDQL